MCKHPDGALKKVEFKLIEGEFIRWIKHLHEFETKGEKCTLCDSHENHVMKRCFDFTHCWIGCVYSNKKV